MRRIPRWTLAASVLSAVLLDLPFPLAGPLPVWRTVFAWFALVPLLVAVLRLADAGESRRWVLGWALGSGWLAGAVWFGLNCYWVYGTMHSYGDMGPALAALCLVLFSLFLGIWFGVFAVALALARMQLGRRGWGWLAVVAIPFLWVGMELCLARVPNFPWDQLGDSMVDNALLMRLVPWTGVYGVSFVLAGVNALFAASAILPAGARGSVRVVCGLAAAVLAGVGLGGFAMKAPRPTVQATAVLVQPNLDVVADNVWTPERWNEEMAAFQKLGGESCKQYIGGMPETGAPMGEVECGPSPEPPALVAWPESPAPFR